MGLQKGEKGTVAASLPHEQVQSAPYLSKLRGKLPYLHRPSVSC